jgi:hypothetical protein
VENPVLVGVMDGAADLGHEAGGPCKGSGGLAKVLAEGAAGHILHGEPWLAIAFACFVDGDDARVGEPGGCFRFQPEPLDFLRACKSSAGDKLEGDFALKARLPCAVDDAHAAAADLFTQEESCEFLRF